MLLHVGFHPSLAAAPGSELLHRHLVSSVGSVLPSLSLGAAAPCGRCGTAAPPVADNRRGEVVLQADTVALWKSVSQAGAE